MELKSGYKQTEVGVIPEDWEADSLVHFWHVTDCKHVTAKFIANGYPIASIKEVQSRFVNLADAKQTTQQFYNSLIEGGRKPQVGDLILSRNATVGEVAQIAEWHPPFAMGQDVCLLRKRSPKSSTDFLQAVFTSQIIGNQLSDLMVGSTFKRANVQQIKNFIVPMPPANEQEAIAEALSDADALIESLEQLIAKKRLIKQGAMQELLTGKKRLPGFEMKPGYKQTEVGVIPEDWEIRRIGTVCKLINGRGFKPFEWQDTGLPIIRIQNLNGSEDFNYYSGTYDKKLEVKPGQLLFAWSGSRGTSFGPHVWSGPFGLLNYHTWKVQIQESEFSKGFMLHELRQLTSYIEGWAHGASALVHVQKWQMESFKVPLPPTKAEQEAIAAILSDMDAEVAALEAKLDKARQIKQGMMQELLTGKTRLI
jgi:type I restriction enzyme, S subunit